MDGKCARTEREWNNEEGRVLPFPQGPATFSSVRQAASYPPLMLLTGAHQPLVVWSDSLLAMLLHRTPYTSRQGQSVQIATLPAGFPVSVPQLGCSEDPGLSSGRDWPLVAGGRGDPRGMSVPLTQALVPSHRGSDVAVVPCNPHTLCEGVGLNSASRPIPHSSPKLQLVAEMSQSSKTFMEMSGIHSPKVGDSNCGTVKGVEVTHLPPCGTKDSALPPTEAKSDSPPCPGPQQTSPIVTAGEKILCTLAEGIVTLGQDGHDTVKEGEAVPNRMAEKPDHPFPALRAFICEQKEELGTDSDSEIEDSAIDGSSSHSDPQSDAGDFAGDPTCSQNELSDSLCAPDLDKSAVPCKKQRDLPSPSPPPLSNEDSHKDSPQSLKGTPTAVECPRLDYPHEVYEAADDGSETVNQALPLEEAREHAVVPRLVSCKEDEGDGSPDEDGGMGTDNHSPPADKQPPSQPLLACKSGPLCLTVDCQRQFGWSPGCTQTSQQVVPETFVETSLPPQTLYEDEVSKSVPCVPSLEDVDIDALDGPTVLYMAMAGVGSRKRKLGDIEDNPPGRPQWEGLNSSAGWRGVPVQPGLVATTPLNLSRPRLRLGLSKHYKRTPLHHIK